jgi:hypothetical protein
MDSLFRTLGVPFQYLLSDLENPLLKEFGKFLEANGDLSIVRVKGCCVGRLTIPFERRSVFRRGYDKCRNVFDTRIQSPLVFRLFSTLRPHADSVT